MCFPFRFIIMKTKLIFARRFVWKQRHKITPKWPIGQLSQNSGVGKLEPMQLVEFHAPVLCVVEPRRNFRQRNETSLLFPYRGISISPGRSVDSRLLKQIARVLNPVNYAVRQDVHMLNSGITGELRVTILTITHSPWPRRTRPVTINMTIAIILQTVKTICMREAHFTLAQFTNKMIPERKISYK